MSDLNKNYYEKITFRDALRLAIHDSMQKDEKIIVMGEDVAAYGGAYGATKDLLKLFGPKDSLKFTPNKSLIKTLSSKDFNSSDINSITIESVINSMKKLLKES